MRQRSRRHYRREQNTAWLPVVQAAENTTPGKITLIATSPLQDFDQICQRQRGIIAPENAPVQGILFSMVLPRFYLTKSDGTVQPPGYDASNDLPDPVRDDESDDFPLWQPFYVNGSNSRQTDAIGFDSKAKRKIGKDELLALCVRWTGGTAGGDITVMGRCLFTWKI